MEITEARELTPGTPLEFNDAYMSKPHALNWTGQKKFLFVRVHRDGERVIVARAGIKSHYTYHLKYMKIHG